MSKKDEDEVSPFLWIFFIILALFVGGFFGKVFFSKTNTNTEDTFTEFCYDRDMKVYPADPVDTSSRGTSDTITDNLCESRNPRYEDCWVSQYCPSCVQNQISCVCQGK